MYMKARVTLFLNNIIVHHLISVAKAWIYHVKLQSFKTVNMKKIKIFALIAKIK